MAEAIQKYRESCSHDVHRVSEVAHKKRWESLEMRMKGQQLYYSDASNGLLLHGMIGSLPAAPPSLRSFVGHLPSNQRNRMKMVPPPFDSSNPTWIPHAFIRIIGQRV